MITSEWEGTERLVELAKRVRRLTLEHDVGMVAKYDQAAKAWQELFRAAGLPCDERTAQTVLLTMQAFYDCIENKRGDRLTDLETNVFLTEVTSMATAVCAAFGIS